MAQKRDHTLIYADGACSGNPGPGGWGIIIITPDDQVIEMGGAENPTTNNKMEMTAVGKALRYLEKVPGDVLLRTDSMYVIKGVTEWSSNWKKKNWKKADGGEVLNMVFWQRLLELIEARAKLGYQTKWEYVKGHSGDAGNDRCDEIAVCFSKNKSVDLYEGPLSSYSVPVRV